MVYNKVLLDCSESQENTGFFRRKTVDTSYTSKIPVFMQEQIFNLLKILVVTYVFECNVCVVPVCQCRNVVLRTQTLVFLLRKSFRHSQCSAQTFLKKICTHMEKGLDLSDFLLL